MRGQHRILFLLESDNRGHGRVTQLESTLLGAEMFEKVQEGHGHAGAFERERVGPRDFTNRTDHRGCRCAHLIVRGAIRSIYHLIRGTALDASIRARSAPRSLRCPTTTGG